jgi:hypothetical protein
MQELQGDLFAFLYQPEYIICIPVNGNLNNCGEAVMGKGVACTAADRLPQLPQILGQLIKERGNHVSCLNTNWRKPHLFSVPTKHNWYEPSDLKLIARSLYEMRKLYYALALKDFGINYVILPRVGCGAGQLGWATVRLIVEEYLPEDNFLIIHHEKDSFNTK